MWWPPWQVRSIEMNGSGNKASPDLRHFLPNSSYMKLSKDPKKDSTSAPSEAQANGHSGPLWKILLH